MNFINNEYTTTLTPFEIKVCIIANYLQTFVGCFIWAIVNNSIFPIFILMFATFQAMWFLARVYQTSVPKNEHQSASLLDNDNDDNIEVFKPAVGQVISV